MLDTSRASGGAKYIQEQKEKDSLLHLELIVTSVARRPLVCDNVPPPLTHPSRRIQSKWQVFMGSDLVRSSRCNSGSTHHPISEIIAIVNQRRSSSHKVECNYNNGLGVAGFFFSLMIECKSTRRSPPSLLLLLPPPRFVCIYLLHGQMTFDHH